jgi:glyoxylase-like metal-dependent hydrolase (beta-lactamase superfamily II)
MRVFDEVNFYPWQSFQENNANSVYIGGAVPTLIDPGHVHLFGNVTAAMARDGVDPARLKLIIFTHAHPDHIEATDLFEDSMLRAIGAREYAYMRDEGKELFLAMGAQPPAKPFRLLLKEGPLFLGQKEFLVIETPGHSPGSICLYMTKEKALIAGDTIFALGVGRTDLPGGDTGLLLASLKKLAKLDIEYLIPGHGDMLKGREAVRKNFDMILSEFF